MHTCRGCNRVSVLHRNWTAKGADWCRSSQVELRKMVEAKERFMADGKFPRYTEILSVWRRKGKEVVGETLQNDIRRLAEKDQFMRERGWL